MVKSNYWCIFGFPSSITKSNFLMAIFFQVVQRLRVLGVLALQHSQSQLRSFLIGIRKHVIAIDKWVQIVFGGIIFHSLFMNQHSPDFLAYISHLPIYQIVRQQIWCQVELFIQNSFFIFGNFSCSWIVKLYIRKENCSYCASCDDFHVMPRSTSNVDHK